MFLRADTFNNLGLLYLAQGCEMKTPYGPKLDWAPDPTLSRADQIKQINGRFRRSLGDAMAACIPGHIETTTTVEEFDADVRLTIFTTVSGYSDREPTLDALHRRGEFRVSGLPPLVWKITAYADKSCTRLSEDSADIASSYRVLTICFADEEHP